MIDELADDREFAFSLLRLAALKWELLWYLSIDVVDAVCSDLYAICVNVCARECVFPIPTGNSFNSKGQRNSVS